MDKIKEKKKRAWWRSRAALAGYAALGVAILAYATLSLSSPGYGVSRATVVMGDVAKGRLEVRVHGNGVLKPLSEQWLVARVSGHVEHIEARAGSAVSEGDLIVRLSNPLLLQAADQLRNEIAAQVAERRALSERLRSDMLDREVAQLRTVRDLEGARFQLERETALVNSDLGRLISEIDYNRTKLNVSQLDKTVKLERDRIASFRSQVSAELAAQDAEIDRLRRQLQRAEEDIASLDVRAPIAGIVQESPLQPGQQVEIGQSMARIIDPAALYAELQIPELQARDLALGLAARVDTRNGIAAGKVVRIDPAVTNGTVKVDVHFDAPAPKGSRPDLSVEGGIDIQSIDSTLLVRRPVMARPGQSAYVYRMLDDDRAERVKVRFGPGSSTQIGIQQGLKAGDRIITSDTSTWGDPELITLKD